MRSYNENKDFSKISAVVEQPISQRGMSNHRHTYFDDLSGSV